MTPSHAQDILGRAGRARGASCFSLLIEVISVYGAGVGMSTPTVVIQPALIMANAAVS